MIPQWLSPSFIYSLWFWAACTHIRTKIRGETATKQCTTYSKLIKSNRTFYGSGRLKKIIHFYTRLLVWSNVTWKLSWWIQSLWLFYIKAVETSSSLRACTNWLYISATVVETHIWGFNFLIERTTREQINSFPKMSNSSFHPSDWKWKFMNCTNAHM